MVLLTKLILILTIICLLTHLLLHGPWERALLRVFLFKALFTPPLILSPSPSLPQTVTQPTIVNDTVQHHHSTISTDVDESSSTDQQTDANTVLSTQSYANEDEQQQLPHVRGHDDHEIATPPTMVAEQIRRFGALVCDVVMLDVERSLYAIAEELWAEVAECRLEAVTYVAAREAARRMREGIVGVAGRDEGVNGHGQDTIGQGEMSWVGRNEGEVNRSEEQVDRGEEQVDREERQMDCGEGGVDDSNDFP